MVHMGDIEGSTPRFLNESGPRAWQIAASFGLILAVYALTVSPDFSLIQISFSLIAALTSIVITPRFPRGLFALWCAALLACWLAPISGLNPDEKRIVFGCVVAFVGLTYQGSRFLFITGVLLALGLSLPSLTEGLKGQLLLQVFQNSSCAVLIGGLATSAALLCARLARAHSLRFQQSLKITGENLENSKSRILAAQESLQLTRDRLLGQVAEGESLLGPEFEQLQEKRAPATAAFEDVVSALRSAFADFQQSGRRAGKIVGPVRFVFFAPVAGYDEKSEIAVDLAALLQGLRACLDLALESLPEMGARKREGVVRLSVRYGFRRIEITIEDNGRGLATKNLQAEMDLASLKGLMLAWGGKLDRIARLGVGSRTSLELRIVRERARASRPTLRHPSDPLTPSVLESAGAPHV